MISMPLTMMNLGEQAEIKRISGKDDTKKFLESLGCVVGTPVCIISKMMDNVIISIRDTRIALDKDMAKRILV